MVLNIKISEVLKKYAFYNEMLIIKKFYVEQQENFKKFETKKIFSDKTYVFLHGKSQSGIKKEFLA